VQTAVEPVSGLIGSAINQSGQLGRFLAGIWMRSDCRWTEYDDGRKQGK